MRTSSIFACMGLIAIAAGVSMFWTSNSGAVSVVIDNPGDLEVAQANSIQRISINVHNATSTRARMVGTNAC